MTAAWTVPETLKGFESLGVRELMGTTQWGFRRPGLTVLITVDDLESHFPGQGVWAHCSLARRDRDPTWSEIKSVRDLVFGRESAVIQLLAPASKWLNVHEHCFHLWMRLDGETVPRMLYDQDGADGQTYGKRAPLPPVQP